jgi:hypothetical protein
MKQFKAIGVAVIAACVMSVVGVATASAAQITYTGTGGFTITSAEGTLETVGGLAITCTSDKGSGKLAASPAKSATLTVTFEGCATAGKKCQTGTDGSGVIKTNELTATIVDLTGGTTVGTVLKPTTGTAFVGSTKCGTVAFAAEGAVVGKLTPVGTKTKTLTDAFVQTAGVQSIQTWVGETTKNHLKAELGKGLEESGLQSSETLTLESGEGTVEA